MKRKLPVFAALAVSLMSSASVPSLKAGELDMKTTITISQPVNVQGTILPAGQYVLKLQDAFETRDVVNIFNSDETQILVTVLPFHTSRMQSTDKSDFSFYQSSAGQPAALRTWFYPGELTGFEFVKPRGSVASNEAQKKTPVPSPQHRVPAETIPAGS